MVCVRCAEEADETVEIVSNRGGSALVCRPCADLWAARQAESARVRGARRMASRDRPGPKTSMKRLTHHGSVPPPI